MLSPSEYLATQQARELSELPNHPGWVHLLKVLDDHEKQMRQELLVVDDPKEIVRAHDIWRIFTRVCDIIKDCPERAAQNYSMVQENSDQDGVDLQIGTFLNTVPTLTAQALNSQMLE